MKNNQCNNYFKLTKPYHKAMSAMSDRQAGEFIKALSAYVFADETPEVTDPFVYGLLVFAKRDIDTARKNRENGQLGALALARKKQEQQAFASGYSVDRIFADGMFEDIVNGLIKKLQAKENPEAERMERESHPSGESSFQWDTAKQDKESGKNPLSSGSPSVAGTSGRPAFRGAKKEQTT